MADRDKNGFFAKGNKIGRGNPFIKQVNDFRAAIIECTTREQIQELIGVLYAKGMSGDVKAAKEYLDRVIGPPKQDIGVTGENGGPIQVQAVRSDMQRLLQNPQLFEQTQKLLAQLSDAVDESESA